MNPKSTIFGLLGHAMTLTCNLLTPTLKFSVHCCLKKNSGENPPKYKTAKMQTS